MRELRGLLDLLGRVTGEIRDQQPTVTINLLTHPEVLAALNVVYGELPRCPRYGSIAQRLQPERLQLEAPSDAGHLR